jgi:osmoprotectant transport system substrate-binding protein
VGCRYRLGALLAALSFTLATVACSSDNSAQPSSRASTNAAIVVGSFDFAESKLLAEIYSQALERAGVGVERAFGLGPREFVAPALERGLVDFVPEYAGTAAQFLSLGRSHDDLGAAVADRSLSALAPAPAQTANTFVMTRATADRLGVRTLSEMEGVASELTMGGPPECPQRRACVAGLEEVYGIVFKHFVTLDAGGSLTRQALRNGAVDVALLFTTDPAVSGNDLVELVDDRGLQPAENITPVVRTEIVERWGPSVVASIDDVSGHLTTDDLRALNAQVAEGTPIGVVAAAWLAAHGAS